MGSAKSILKGLKEKKEKGIKSFAVLIDPDDTSIDNCRKLVNIANESKVDYFFVGGSLITSSNMSAIIACIKNNCQIPVVIFPGNSMHLDSNADALLFLSLISGRNPEYLIGQHVIAAPMLKRSKLEILPTGYVLVDSGKQTTVNYISNTTPVPADKPSVAASTAMAGEMLGLKLIYMDGGSGAETPISAKMIATVRKSVECPIIVGGGIKNTEKAKTALDAGADLIVVGNSIEDNPTLIIDIANKVAEINELAFGI